MRKRMKLVRMNTHEYEASANDFIPSSGMEGSAGWAGAWESQDFECCFQLQTLSALQVALNL